jgi:hypothetical protein
MNKINLICIFFILFFSHGKNGKNGILDHSVQYDNTLTDSFFFQNNWSYPSMTTKYGNDQFDNSYGKQIVAADTAHLYHTAAIFTFDSFATEDFIKQNCINCQIDFGEAYLIGDSLFLKFIDSTPSSYDNLEIKIIDNAFSSTFLRGAPPIGNRHYIFDKEKLILQKEYYAKGDTIKGYLDFQSHTPRFIHLKGFFKVLVNDTPQ